MLKIIKTLLKDNILYIAIIITFIIAYLSLIKVGKQPITVKYLDKIEHGIAYATLALSWLLALKNKVKIATIIIGCIIYGTIIEVLQGTITNYRTADFYDIIANSIGILIALLIFKVFFEKNKLFNS